jgi:hypothetical protein
VIDHVSDLQWDRLLAGELALDMFSAANAHARACDACATRLRELTAERDAFTLRPFKVLRPRANRRASWIVPVVIAAAGVLIAVRFRLGLDEAEAPGEHRKGGAQPASVRIAADDAGPTLVLAAGRPDALSPVTSGDDIHPGDYLQAGYTAPRDGFGAVLSCDGAGSVSAYVPPDGAAMVALPAGTARSFPHSTILDGALGSERIAIVWCVTAHPLEPLLASLRAHLPLAVPDDCVVREVTLDKR